MDYYDARGRRLDEPEEPLPAPPTPGPWRYAYGRYGATDFALANVDVDADYQGKPTDYGSDFLQGSFLSTDDAENEANARLLAAAPDLYTALARLLQTFATDGFTERQLMQALRGAREALRYAREGDRVVRLRDLDPDAVYEVADPDDEPSF